MESTLALHTVNMLSQIRSCMLAMPVRGMADEAGLEGEAAFSISQLITKIANRYSPIYGRR